MMKLTSVPTRDKPTTADGAVIVDRRPKPPVGRYELREDGGDVITVLVATNDAAHTARDEALRTSGESLKRMAVAAGGGQHAR